MKLLRYMRHARTRYRRMNETVEVPGSLREGHNTEGGHLNAAADGVEGNMAAKLAVCTPVSCLCDGTSIDGEPVPAPSNLDPIGVPLRSSQIVSLVENFVP